MRSPSLAPSAGPEHIVLCDFGKHGVAFREIEPATSERSVVESILTGDFETPLSVIAFDASEGWSRDVSEDVAGKVVKRARAEGRKLTEGARRFVEQHLDEDVEPELCA